MFRRTALALLFMLAAWTSVALASGRTLPIRIEDAPQITVAAYCLSQEGLGGEVCAQLKDQLRSSPVFDLSGRHPKVSVNLKSMTVTCGLNGPAVTTVVWTISIEESSGSPVLDMATISGKAGVDDVVERILSYINKKTKR